MSGFGLELGIDSKRVRILDLAEAVEVELSDEGGEFIVFEKLGDDFLFEGGGVFDNESFPVIGPGGYEGMVREV